MSSIAHVKVHSVSKEKVMEAAMQLKLNTTVETNSVSIPSIRAKFLFETNGTVDVAYESDTKAKRMAQKVLQVATYNTVLDKVKSAGFKVTTATSDVMAALSMNQALSAELVAVQ